MRALMTKTLFVFSMLLSAQAMAFKKWARGPMYKAVRACLRVAAFLFLSLTAASVNAQTCADLDGAYVIAQDGTDTYLGFFGSQFATESIMNQFGTYGNQFSTLSVRSTIGTYGNSFSPYSVNNDFASSPPRIYKYNQFLYYLSTNNFKAPNITLAQIDASCSFTSFAPAGGGTSLPSPPALVIAQDGQSTDVLQVAWSAGTGATSYDVYISTTNSNYTYLGNTSLLYTGITDLEQGITYYVAVTSVNAAGVSTSVYDTGYLATASPSLPSPPESVSVQDGQSTESLNVAWTAGSGANSYNIYISTTNSNYEYIGNQSGLTAGIMGQTQGIIYYVKVTSVNAAGESLTYNYDTGYLATSAATFVITPFADLGGAITPSAAQTVVEGATAQFTLIPDIGYSVASVVGSCGGSIAGNSYTTNAVTADCFVRAIFEKVTTAPSAPIIIRTDGGDGEVYLVVSVADDGGSTISRYTATCTDGTTQYTDTSSTSRITVSGLTNGVGYSCSVTATNAAGTSPESASSPPIVPEYVPVGLPIWLLFEASK